MSTAKKNLTISEIVESHKPKNFKYKYIFSDEQTLFDLEKEGYDVTSLDTIQNDALVEAALQTEFQEYPRETVTKAKEPTVLDNGVILSKKMVTKADKKLYGVYVGFFDFQDIYYVATKLKYEKFDILEIFILC